MAGKKQDGHRERSKSGRPRPVSATIGRAALTKQLDENAASCDVEAALSLEQAKQAIGRSADRDVIVRHITDALLYVGEARGHLNAIADVAESI